MKTKHFLILSAVFSAASMLAACQKADKTGKAEVQDGHAPRGKIISPAAKAGEPGSTTANTPATTPGDDLSQTNPVKCTGFVKIGENTFQIDKLVNWDRKTALSTELRNDGDVSADSGTFNINLAPDSVNSTLTIESNLDKDKVIRVTGSLQSKVRLVFQNDGTIKTEANVLCNLVKTEAIPTLKLNSDKQLEATCAGKVDAASASKDLHEGGAENIKVSSADGTSLNYDKLSLMKTSSLSLKSKLYESDSIAGTTLDFETADAKLKVRNETYGDIVIGLEVSSVSSKEKITYGCQRSVSTSVNDSTATDDSVTAPDDAAQQILQDTSSISQ